MSNKGGGCLLMGSSSLYGVYCRANSGPNLLPINLGQRKEMFCQETEISTLSFLAFLTDEWLYAVSYRPPDPCSVLNKLDSLTSWGPRLERPNNLWSNLSTQSHDSWVTGSTNLRLTRGPRPSWSLGATWKTELFSTGIHNGKPRILSFPFKNGIERCLKNIMLN